MKSKKGSSKIKYVAFAPSQKSDNKLVYQFASSHPETSPAMPSHNCISKRGGQFTAEQLLSIDSSQETREETFQTGSEVVGPSCNPTSVSSEPAEV